jgi:integrase
MRRQTNRRETLTDTMEPTHSRWSWPIDRTQYDRTPELSPDELAALIALEWDVRRGRCHDSTRPEWTTIARLVRPLDDARLSLYIPSTNTPYHQRSVLDAVGLILHGCRTCQTAFWQWDEATWVEVLGANQHAFQRKDLSGWGWLDATVRSYMIAIAYLLDCFSAFQLLGPFNRLSLATKVFGPTVVKEAIDQIYAVLQGWGYRGANDQDKYRGLICTLLLLNRSPYLADLTTPALEQFRVHRAIHYLLRSPVYAIHRAVAALGYVDPPTRLSPGPEIPVEGVHATWQQWVERWTKTSTLTHKVRRTFRTILLKVGRWLAHAHPDVYEPGQWTRELCAEYLAMVERLCIGDYVQRRAPLGQRIGRPLSARSKAGYIVAVRTFFHDCQEWEWIARRFDPSRALATPRSIRALTGPNPRVISDAVWAKLVWAGLNLEADDLPANTGGQFYPLELVRALAVTWLFAGLRSDELSRLRLGCIRWQRDDVEAGGQPTEDIPKAAVCLLDVPTHKTGSAFTKPVDPLVGQAITAWEAVRPVQPSMLDRRTGESVQFLFCYRATRVAKEYLNIGLIPALGRKAGVPLEDVRGRITSHRARATIASQLYNAKEPMTLFELQAWLGHQSAETTQYYARITPTTLAKAYTDAGYFSRNVRTIEVLIDRETIESGAAATGTPWQYFDLGHGYCTYSFFEQCPHRMACARCDFYLPKSSTRGQLLEAKENLQRMLATIPLTEEERAAVEDGEVALDHLLEQLVDIPTPAGPTPRQLTGVEYAVESTLQGPHASAQGLKTVIPLERVHRKR